MALYCTVIYRVDWQRQADLAVMRCEADERAAQPLNEETEVSESAPLLNAARRLPRKIFISRVSVTIASILVLVAALILK